MKHICPVCGKSNGCAIEIGIDPQLCWCMSIKVPKSLLETIPSEQRGKSCVCKACVLVYKQKFEAIHTWVEDAVLDLRYMTKNNFVGDVMYPKAFDCLRVGTLDKLKQAADALRSMGYRIVVWDAYRPRFVQERFWDLIQDDRFVAPPWIGSSHNRGCAIDLTLADLEGNLLNMPTDFDCFSESAGAYASIEDEEIEKRLRTLQACMTSAGFQVYRHEWWHFVDSEEDLYRVENDIKW